MTASQRGPWTRKPISIVLQEEQDENTSPVNRHLSLVDLVSVGVGGTIGSGIFVLTGFIAKNYAGPSTFLSFILSGLAASCSGLCYAEWAVRLPAAGSTYIYAYVCLGEWAAVVAGACLTLEYGVSGAAVARSWGDKVVEWMQNQLHWENAGLYLGQEYFNPLAGLISILTVIMLTCGVQESKNVTNFFTLLKIILVLFMIIGGLMCFRAQNLTPLAPFGIAGILRGATSSFFGYLGYDEVCCMASEAKNPTDLPRAILWTLAIVTIFYALASISLVGMLPFEEISATSGFPDAFAARGYVWASQITAAGEVITLPVVVLIALMAQPRLCAAMAHDGLLPQFFSRKYERQHVFLSTMPMTILATFVPFNFLDDAISVAILIAFNMTNSSLIIMKCESPRRICCPRSLSKSLVLYHLLALVAGVVSHVKFKWIPLLFLFVTIGYAVYLHYQYPPTSSFGDSSLHRHDSKIEWESLGNDVFQTPLMPILPLLGIGINWYLIAQLEWTGMLLLLSYLGFVSLLYFVFGRNKSDWVSRLEHEEEGDILLEEMSPVS